MRLKVRDIFTIPIDEDKIGFGHVIYIPNKNYFLIGVYETAYYKSKLPRLEEIVKGKILFLGYTLDAKLFHKHWVIIGNYVASVSSILLPYFKLGTPPDVKIVNFKGDIIRKAKQNEAEKLDYETVVAPIRYENALKAYHKKIEWDTDFNKLLYTETIKSIDVVEGKEA